ncbi:MAG: 4Fe-4S binding protein [Syntrophales bacterium]|nr:4Fe-4S binding protein [Syntrophales bacterium]
MAKVKVIVFHPDRCKGDLECEKACSNVHFKTKDGGEKSAIRIVRDKAGTFRAMVCNQCGLCIDMCPPQALRRLASGIVTLDKNACVGCKVCVAFCPMGGMHKAAGIIVPFKCISCGMCVKACPEKALELKEFELSDLECEVHARHRKVCK